MTGWAFSLARASTQASKKASGRATVTEPVPRTAMAFSFLEPITVPMPPRPAARCLSFMMAEKRQPVSPAGAMQAMRNSSPSSSRSRSVVSNTSLPHRWAASRSSTVPSLM